MTSSTKPEVHNKLPCRRCIEPLLEVTRTGNFVKFGVQFLKYASGQTNRHTDILKQSKNAKSKNTFVIEVIDS